MYTTWHLRPKIEYHSFIGCWRRPSAARWHWPVISTRTENKKLKLIILDSILGSHTAEHGKHRMYRCSPEIHGGKREVDYMNTRSLQEAGFLVQGRSCKPHPIFPSPPSLTLMMENETWIIIWTFGVCKRPIPSYSSAPVNLTSLSSPANENQRRRKMGNEPNHSHSRNTKTRRWKRRG